QVAVQAGESARLLGSKCSRAAVPGLLHRSRGTGRRRGCSGGPEVLIMLLTDGEKEFLAAFIYEATNDPFNGPATEELHRRNIYYTDPSHLMAAYYGENAGDKEGLGGKHHSTPPACPWKDRDSAVRRDHEVEVDLERTANQTVP